MLISQNAWLVQVHMYIVLYNVQSYIYSFLSTLQNEERTAYSFIKFQFLSNHGSLDYTCVYRVRVHGSLAAVQ